MTDGLALCSSVKVSTAVPPHCYNRISGGVGLNVRSFNGAQNPWWHPVQKDNKYDNKHDNKHIELEQEQHSPLQNR